MSSPYAPLERLVFDAEALMANHPPVWRHPNKHLVHAVACPPGSAMAGELTYTRWTAMPLPEAVDVRAAMDLVEPRQDLFDYADRPNPDAVHWHVNFADPHLFVAYGSALFAQDEMQVAEHPALGALREALAAGGHAALTVENGRPTPVLIQGVERRCRVATNPDSAAGRPEGLYGNAFARASADAVRRATTRLDPPTRTNLISMAAPHGGHGPYKSHEIEHVLITASTGFRAAVLESSASGGDPAPVVVHTGWWGCGAFGGNRVLMATLQALAAQMAGLHRLVLHTATDTAAWDAARRLLERLTVGAQTPTADLIERLVAERLEWGVSDGN